MITVFSFNVITKSDDIIYMLNWTRSEASSFHTHIQASKQMQKMLYFCTSYNSFVWQR